MAVAKRPLSWGEARTLLCQLLEAYLEESQSSRKVTEAPRTTGKETSPLSFWIRRDLDLYAGSLALSIALFILSCFSLAERQGGVGNGSLHPGADVAIYRGQLAASVLLVAGSIVSLWMVRRRRFLCNNDGENAKRREIFRFVRAMKSQEEDGAAVSSKQADAMSLWGTALTDIYPVYRRSGSAEDSPATWGRVPSLLLVEGDFIALQIGDIAPANCAVLDALSSEELASVVSGDRIEFSSFGDTPASVINELPRGRTTLPPDSDHLLTLCNKMRVFRVLKAPLDDFIHRSSAPSKPSELWRQLKEIRKALSLIAVVCFVATAAIVFSRPQATSGDLSLILPLPFLAALGVLPVVGPAFIFFLEVLGTARILRTVHPHASSSVGDADSSKSALRLLLRYILAATLSRLSLWDFAGWVRINLLSSKIALSEGGPSKLVRVPPASINLLEKLGVATAFVLVDDELACDPQSIPQQLLIPSRKGLKLLDLCPAYDDDDIDAESAVTVTARGRPGKSNDDSDSDSDTVDFKTSLRRKVLRRRQVRRRRSKRSRLLEDNTDDTDDSSVEIQFEDPLWWQHLPSLKCIGLACLLIDEPRSQVAADSEVESEREEVLVVDEEETEASFANEVATVASVQSDLAIARSTLVKVVSSERRTNQLRYLAQCIGFSTEPNVFGPRGDLTPFTERMRFHILSDSLFKGRLEIDAHERSSEQSRWWGLIRPDATSAIVQDSRSGAYQILTVGDPAVVASVCNEAWQGEISTILPLGATDRQTILDTTNSWKLGDLDVSAFSYSPVPRTFEDLIVGDENETSQMYLLDHGSRGEQSQSLLKDKNVSQEWSLIRNQVFLGVLGSLVVPRREIHKLLGVLNEAGVRFVYFSPRNMRRQKELAMQMGIDVAWNCAISLRPLESGEDDPHRMVSNYADWDINAKLPHGVEDVRKHLEEVDNVPLLVSLYTDVSKETTRDMVEIFQEYSDTVIAIGLSHLPRNDRIFSTADISVGIDVLSETLEELSRSSNEALGTSCNQVLPSEVEFCSAIASHSCAFRFRGAESLVHVSSIIAQGRAALEAAIASGVFLIVGCLSFSLFVLFSVCDPSTTVPFVPTLGAVLYLQIILPCIGLTMAMKDGDVESMQQVPRKNDQSMAFSRREGWRLYKSVILKAIPPALLPQLLHFIAFGELILYFEPDLVASECPGATRWVDIVRCDALKDYSGVARTSSGVLVLVEFVICTIVASASFVQRFASARERPPWRGNRAWVWAVLITLGLTSIYAAAAVESGSKNALPWYWYLLAAIMPWICFVWNEWLKPAEAKQDTRSEKLRRLQFETRLGAWSPK